MGTPRVILSTPTMIGRPNVVLPLAVPAPVSASSSLPSSVRYMWSMLYVVTALLSTPSPPSCLPFNVRSSVISLSCNGCTSFGMECGSSCGPPLHVCLAGQGLQLHAPSGVPPPAPHLQSPHCWFPPLSSSIFSSSSIACSPSSAPHSLMNNLDIEALLRAPPPRRRFTLLFSSCWCHHDVHDVHSISLSHSEPQCVVRHLVLNV